jgi:hypothetical protein
MDVAIAELASQGTSARRDPTAMQRLRRLAERSRSICRDRDAGKCARQC